MNSYESEPSLFAAFIGDHSTVRRMFQRGGVNEMAIEFEIACERGNVEEVKKLIEYGALKKTWRLLHYHTVEHWEVLDLLIDHGIDVNAVSAIDGSTSLHIASKKGYAEFAEFLIENGANIHAQDENGDTPLFIAIKNHHLGVAKHLIEHYQNGWTLLHEACTQGNVMLVKCITANGSVHLNAKDNDGRTPLACACEHNRLEVVEFLLDIGADIHFANSYGWAAIHWACKEGQSEIAQFLVRRGANINMETTQGLTPLQLASQRKHAEIVWFFVRQYPLLALEL